MQLSSIIGKPILSPGGEQYGYVTDARLARGYGRISCLICADADEEEFYLPARAVRSFGDAVIVGRARLDAPAGLPSPIGLSAYSHRGDSLGGVADLLLAGHTDGILVLEKEGVRITIPAANCLIGKTVIVYPDRRARAASRSAPRRTAPMTTAPMPKSVTSDMPTMSENAPTMSENMPTMSEGEAQNMPISGDTTPEAATMSETEEHAYGEIMSVSVNLGRTDLLGRQVKRSVYDCFGNLVAMAGERVTPAVLSRARRANKLLELTVKTISNL